MIEFNIIWLIILIVNVISFGLMILFSYLKGRKKYDGFSFANHFPYECFSNIAKIFSIIFIISLFASLGTILPFVGDLKENSILPIVITFVIGVSGIFMLIVFYLPLKYQREHLICSTLLMSGAFLSVALAVVRQFVAYSMLNRFNEGGYHLALGIVGVLFIVLMAVVIFNPKLKQWALLDEHIQGEEKYYTRPKFFPLAYSEWISMLVILFAQILFLTSLIN